MKEKVENTEVALVMLPSPKVIPYCMRVDCSYPDYSVYFEPTADTIRHISENEECIAPGIADFSNYFEPVAAACKP